MFEETLSTFYQKISQADKFSIYCAGEFAALAVQYCISKNLREKMDCCVISQREIFDVDNILGVPVIEYCDFSGKKNALIVVAVLNEKVRSEIRESLMADGFNNLYLLSREEYSAINELIADFSADIRSSLIGLRKDVYRLAQQLQNVQDYIDKRLYHDLTYLVKNINAVTETHKANFGPYKGINKGKTIIICAPGESLNKYEYDPEFVHIGVNSTLLQERIKLDYAFLQHFPSEKDSEASNKVFDKRIREQYFYALKNTKCVKFIGQLLGSYSYTSPPFGEFSDGNFKTYYLADYLDNDYCVDIRYGLIRGGNIVLSALQFALFTNPEKIYLVGCDGYTNGKRMYFHKEYDRLFRESISDTMREDINSIMRDHHISIKEFAEHSYPNTEIIMVNPVCYSGIYNETTTNENGRIIAGKIEG